MYSPHVVILEFFVHNTSNYNLTGCLLFQAFNDLGVPYEVHELDKMPDGMSVQDVLDNMTGARTVSTTFSIIFTFRF